MSRRSTRGEREPFIPKSPISSPRRDVPLKSLIDRSSKILDPITSPISSPPSQSTSPNLLATAKVYPYSDIIMENKGKDKGGKEEKTTKSLIEVEEGAEIDINDLFQGLDNPLDYEKLLLPANAKTLDEVVKAANGNESPAGVSSVVGTLIEPGKIGIVDHNGKIQVLPPGRYIFPNPRSKLTHIASLNDNIIKKETLTIIRVARGEVGLATENGFPFVLGEGLHVRNSRVFQFIKTDTVNQQYIRHGTIHIIRVPQGHYGLCTENAIPKLLREGTHVTNSAVFSFDGLQLINQPYVRHGTMHILRIPKGKVALVTNNNKPQLLEGTHCINSKVFTYTEMQDLSQQVIKHGTISRFRVRKGEVGLAWENNEPVFFQEGIYEKDSPNFTFERCVSAGEKVITLGAKKIVTVFDGEVGVSYLKGKLVVLKPDRHIIESAEHVFQGFLSTQQQCLHLVRSEKDKDGILTCETKDFVEIGLYADVFYKIIDPERCLLVVGKDNVMTLVRETAIATLNSIIRSTALGEIAQNKEFAAKSQAKDAHASTTMFFDKVHDEFISKLHDSFMEKYGIEITNIRIESFKIMNQELSNNISKQALVTAQTENQLANLTGQTEIATAQMKRDAEVNRIKAEGDAIRLKTETDAKNKAIMETAKAESDSTVIRAKADAQAIELRAEAEAKAILLRADAEAKRAEMIQKTPLGGQLAIFEVYANMVKSSMQGVQKVIYLPSDGASNGGTANPMAFLAMQPNMISGFVSGLTEPKKEKKSNA